MSLLDLLLENTQAKTINFCLNTSISQHQTTRPQKQMTPPKQDQRPRSISFFSLSQQFANRFRHQRSMTKLSTQRSPDQVLPITREQEIVRSLNKISYRIKNKILKRFYQFWVNFQKFEAEKRQALIPEQRMNVLKEGLNNLVASLRSIEYRKYCQMRVDEEFWTKLGQQNEKLSCFKEGMMIIQKIERRIKKNTLNRIQEKEEESLRIEVFQDTVNIFIKKIKTQSFQNIIQCAKMKEISIPQIIPNQNQCCLRSVIAQFKTKTSIKLSDEHNHIERTPLFQRKMENLIPNKPDQILDDNSPQNIDNSTLFIVPPEFHSRFPTEPNYPCKQKSRRHSTQKTPQSFKNTSLLNSRVKNGDSLKKNDLKQHTWKEDKQILSQIIANLSNKNSPCKQQKQIFRNTLSSFQWHETEAKQEKVAAKKVTKNEKELSNSLKLSEVKQKEGGSTKQKVEEQKSRNKQIISLRSKRKNSGNQGFRKIEIKKIREFECERINITLCQQQVSRETTPKKWANPTNSKKSSITFSPLQARQNIPFI